MPDAVLDDGADARPRTAGGCDGRRGWMIDIAIFVSRTSAKPVVERCRWIEMGGGRGG